MAVPDPPTALPTANAPASATDASGGGGRIRTYEGVSRQIYSLLPLAAWVPLPKKKRAAYSDFGSAGCQCRFRAKRPFISRRVGPGSAAHGVRSAAAPAQVAVNGRPDGGRRVGAGGKIEIDHAQIV